MKYAAAIVYSLLALGAVGFTAITFAGPQTCHSSIVMGGGMVLSKDRTCS